MKRKNSRVSGFESSHYKSLFYGVMASTTDFDSVLMIDLWCNGNTQVFGTRFPSSSLGRSTFIL